MQSVFNTKIVIAFLLLFSIKTINISAHNHESNSDNSAINFVPNLGQWDGDFIYRGFATSSDIFLRKSGVTYIVGASDNSTKMHNYKMLRDTSVQTLNFHAYKVQWKNANPNPNVVPAKKQVAYHNYYLGNQENRWKTNVGLYQNLTYEKVYPNIDVAIASQNGNLKYDFIVKPGGNTNDIILEFEGTDEMYLENGQLFIKTSVGQIIEMAPYTYQYVNEERKEVPSKYVLKGKQVTFEFPKGYNKAHNLIIDPVIVFASLSGSTADNWGFSATYDAAGNLYGGGITNGLGYPATTGAFQRTYGGGSFSSTMPCDISISKFSSNGNSLIYATYIGGIDDEMPHSMIVDANNNLIVAGKTLSNNYPTLASSLTPNYIGGLSDIFITKFNAAGSALIGSTFIGGTGNDGVNISYGFNSNQNTLKFNYGDDSRSEVNVDNQGNIYLVGNTQSADFRVTPNAVKSSIGGQQDGVFVKLNPTLSQLIYSTYIGGRNNDAAYVIAFDASQANVFIAGGTQSDDFHLSSMVGSYLPSYQGGISDGFITKFQNSGNYNLLKSTYIGTNDYDQCFGVQVDHSNNVYVMGQTKGSYPVSAGVYSNPGSKQFVHKLNNTLTTSLISTVFGSGNTPSPNLSLVAFLVDTCENVYISGWGGPSITPGTNTFNLPVTADAFQATTDGSDMYFIVFSKNFQSLLFASFFGNNARGEHVDGGTSRFNPIGEVYQAICASCGGGTGYPSTPGAYSTLNRSPNCNLGVVKIAFNLGSVSARALANPSTIGCAPFVVNFTNSSTNATNYLWIFGDGTPNSVLANPSHTYQNPGTYYVRMIANNPNACVEYDTSYLTIVVRNDTINGNFSYAKLDSCDAFTVRFTNLSTRPSSFPANSTNYLWDFGDGTTYTGITPPVHNYLQLGNYTVTLTITDTNACNSPLVITKTLNFNNNNVKVSLPNPNLLCINDSVDFNPTYLNGLTYEWNFGDGNTSTIAQPKHRYAAAGTYTARVIVRNPNTCNLVDSATIIIQVFDNPTAMFSFTPLQPETNIPIQFRNQSENYFTNLWDFGDGRTSDAIHPSHAFHSTGEFRVCLTVTNEAGCIDKICRTVYSKVISLAELPTAFSPNGDGNNDILFVRGYNVATIDLKIYNRFGNLIFESDHIDKGWDGTYKGTPQEMEAYAFILNATFLDGSTATQKGNVTLIR